MKLKRICFAPTINPNSRSLAALGGSRTDCYIGLRVVHPAFTTSDGSQRQSDATVVSSMELDRQAGLVFIRQVYEEGEKKGKPYRRQTCNQTLQPGEEADCIAVTYDERSIMFFDDDAQEQKGK